MSNIVVTAKQTTNLALWSYRSSSYQRAIALRDLIAHLVGHGCCDVHALGIAIPLGLVHGRLGVAHGGYPSAQCYDCPWLNGVDVTLRTVDLRVNSMRSIHSVTSCRGTLVGAGHCKIFCLCVGQLQSVEDGWWLRWWSLVSVGCCSLFVYATSRIRLFWTRLKRNRCKMAGRRLFFSNSKVAGTSLQRRGEFTS